MIAGEVKGYGLVEVINYVLKKNLTGIIHVKSGHLDGEIHLSNGIVAGATSGVYSGEDVFFEFLGFDSVSFHVEETNHIQSNITKSLPSLIQLYQTRQIGTIIGSDDVIISSPVFSTMLSIDSDMHEIIDLCKEGQFFHNLLTLTGKSDVHLKELIARLSSMDMVAVHSVKKATNIFLFPKNACMMPSSDERDLLRQIYSGMSLLELVERTIYTPCSLAAGLTWLAVKKALTMSNGKGTMLQAWHMMEALGMTNPTCGNKLMTRVDRSLNQRPGVVKVDVFQMLFWSQVLRGKEVVAVSIPVGNQSHLFKAEGIRNNLGQITMTSHDMDLIGASENDFLECKPETSDLF